MKSAVAPPASQTAFGIGRGVVGDRRRDREPDQHAEREEEADGELLRGANREVHAEQAGERGEEEEEAHA